MGNVMRHIYGHISGKVPRPAPADDNLPSQHHEAYERWRQLAYI